MSVTKSFGFGGSSPYRSMTFNQNNELVFSRNGVLSIGSVETIGQNIVLQDVVFIQKGVIVKREGSVLVPFPENLEPPFYLTANTPDTRPVDNIVWSFVRRPQDIGESVSLISEWDGQEWRSLDKLSLDEIVKDRKIRAIAYNNLGFNNGFRIVPTPDFTSYLLTAGQITDKTGQLVTKNSGVTFDAIPEDPDFPRIDSLLWRRFSDSDNRIGMPILRPGRTVSEDEDEEFSVFEDEVSSDSVTKDTQIVVLSDNSYILFRLDGYGLNGQLQALKYDSERNYVSNIYFSSNVRQFNATSDRDGNVLVAFSDGQTISRTKIDPDLNTILPEGVVSNLSNPAIKPVVKSDINGNYHILFLYEISPNTFTPYYLRLNLGGTVSVNNKRLIVSGNSYESLDFDINEDLIIHAVYHNLNTTQIEYQRLSDVGDPIASIEVLSNDTLTDIDDLDGNARKPRAILTENNLFYAFWEQDKGGSEYGLAVYNSSFDMTYTSKAVMVSFEEFNENLNAFSIDIDWQNYAHIIYSTEDGLFYNQVYLPRLESKLEESFQIVEEESEFMDIKFDKWGSLVYSWATLQDGFEASGATSDTIIGSGNFGAESAFVGGGEIAVPTAQIQSFNQEPTIEDSIAIDQSLEGNDGSYEIINQRQTVIDGVPYTVYQVTPSFTSTEQGAIADFTSLSANVFTVAKQNASAPINTSDMLNEELDSDIFAGFIHRPSNIIEAWYDRNKIKAGDIDLRDDNFLASGANINWVPSGFGDGTLSWDDDLHVTDPFRLSFRIEAGQIGEFAEDDVLYVILPKAEFISRNPEGETIYVEDSSKFTVGSRLFISDSSSGALYAEVTEVSVGQVEVDTDVSDFRVSKGAYVIPADLELWKAPQNEGDLRPNSLGEVDNQIYTIAFRKANLIYFRDGGLTLMPNETGQIGDGASQQTLTFIGASSQADSAPQYGVPSVIPEGTSLREAASILAGRFLFDPANPADWANGLPETIEEGLDFLAFLHRYFEQLKITKHPTIQQRILISGADIELPDGAILSSEINEYFKAFNGATVDFMSRRVFTPTGQPLGEDFLADPGVPVGQYKWYGIGLIEGSVSSNNRRNVQVKISPSPLSSPNAENAPFPEVEGELKIGAVQIFNAPAGGGLQVAQIRRLLFTRNKEVPDDEVVDEVVDDSATVDGDRFISLIPPNIRELTLEDANGVRWDVTVDNEGLLTTTPNSTRNPDPLFRVPIDEGEVDETVTLETDPILTEGDEELLTEGGEAILIDPADPEVAQVIVNTDGSLALISPPQPEALLSPIDINYYIAAPDGTAWKIGACIECEQMVIQTVSHQNIFEIKSENVSHFAIKQTSTTHALTFTQVYNIISLPVEPPKLDGLLPQCFYDNGDDIRPIYHDGDDWRYFATNDLVLQAP